MELSATVRRRRMVRSFEDRPITRDEVEAFLELASHAPTAGNTRGTAWLVLAGRDETSLYWRHTTTADWRAQSSRWPGLSRAPVVALCITSPRAYVDRYGEPDKRSSGLGPADNGGGDEAAWPIPYWFGDAAFATMVLLLKVTDGGLGACFLGNFRGEAPLFEALGVPQELRLFGAVVIGHADGQDHRSRSLDRATGTPVVHWGRWGRNEPTDAS